MISVIRPSDCSTSVGIVRADEATGIWAKVLAAEATSAVSKATRAIKRGMLADIKTSYSLDFVAGGSSMICDSTRTHVGGVKSGWRLPHGFLGCQLNA